MEVIEITYRYDATDATLRPRPADALAALAFPPADAAAFDAFADAAVRSRRIATMLEAP